MHQVDKGWITGDNIRHILHRMSGSIGYLDFNGANAYDLLMGCRDLLKLGSHHAIVKGDSFSAIQWESGHTKCP